MGAQSLIHGILWPSEPDDILPGKKRLGELLQIEKVAQGMTEADICREKWQSWGSHVAVGEDAEKGKPV